MCKFIDLGIEINISRERYHHGNRECDVVFFFLRTFVGIIVKVQECASKHVVLLSKLSVFRLVKIKLIACSIETCPCPSYSCDIYIYFLIFRVCD